MFTGRKDQTRWRRLVWCVLFCAPSIFIASCNSGQPLFTPTELDQGWPDAELGWRPKSRLPANWAEGKDLWKPTSLGTMKVPVPVVPEAEFTDLDAQCVVCHETYVTAFSTNVHRQQSCEKCHGATSKHLGSRGGSPDTILSLSPPDRRTVTGQPTSPAEQAELCLQCHDTLTPEWGTKWRASAHTHRNVSCPDCHSVHYDVPPGTPPADVARRTQPDGRLVQWSPQATPQADLSRHLGAITPDNCYRCHEYMKRFEDAGHPHQIGSEITLPEQSGQPNSPTNSQPNPDGKKFDCTTCHSPHGNVEAYTRKELCLTCHDGPHMQEWHGSPHDLAGIGCTDCHNPHPESGRAMTVQTPQVCYRCHSETRQLEQIAGPHQLLGPNKFNCTSCHRPHGRVTTHTRTDLCLGCHTGSPTMAWHSSYHDRQNVACADCHDAHPDANLPQVMPISHTTVNHLSGRPMRVAEPDACFKCHPQVFAEASLPSHHPIREGKIRCSDCHNAHGEEERSLKAQTLNELCFECHAELEGPFVWEHAPVTESCANCHKPHGTVANDLLQQPPMFLCLRCHTGHSTHGASLQCTRCHDITLPGGGLTTLVGGYPANPQIPTTPESRQALFTDCTQCHSQIHGSDLATGFECGQGMRR